MKEVFEMQDVLNDYILAKAGSSWSMAKANDSWEKEWVPRFAEAFQAEYAELLECTEFVEIDRAMAKVEIVDMIHFLCSLSIMVKITPGEAECCLTEGAVSYKRSPSANIPVLVFGALDKIHSGVPWKWWQSGGLYDEVKVREGVVWLWSG